MEMIARSLLYVPADQPAKLDKSLTVGADAVILDLEDAVAPQDKARARAAAARWLERADLGGVEIWVRINSGTARRDDLDLVLGSEVIAGVCLAKCGSAADAHEVANTFAERGRDIKIMPLIESALGVLAAPNIAGVPAVWQMQLGEVDLSADLGITPLNGDELDPYRAQIVLASAAAQLAAPPAPVAVETRDPDRFRHDTKRLRRLGFWGRVCIHPAQVPIANEVFTPTDAELAEARRTLAQLEAAGDGATVDPQGRMVDAAVARHARLILARR